MRACASRRDSLDYVLASSCSLEERQSTVDRSQGAPTCNRAADLGELDLRGGMRRPDKESRILIVKPGAKVHQVLVTHCMRHRANGSNQKQYPMKAREAATFRSFVPVLSG